MKPDPDRSFLPNPKDNEVRAALHLEAQVMRAALAERETSVAKREGALAEAERRVHSFRFWLFPLAAILLGLIVTAWSLWNVLR